VILVKYKNSCLVDVTSFSLRPLSPISGSCCLEHRRRTFCNSLHCDTRTKPHLHRPHRENLKSPACNTFRISGAGRGKYIKLLSSAVCRCVYSLAEISSQRPNFDFLFFSSNNSSSGLIVPLPNRYPTQTPPRLGHLSYRRMSFSAPCWYLPPCHNCFHLAVVFKYKALNF
jgi:hypothetical protein